MATPGPRQDGSAFSKSLPPTPTVLGGPEPPHPGSPRPLGLGAGALRDADGSWDHEGEGRRPRPPLAPMPCSPGPPRPRCPAPTHASCPVHPSHRRSSGSKWFPPWPHPPQSGVGGQGGTWPTHRCHPLRSHHVSVPVCVPASSLPLLSAASLLVALSTLQPLHSCPTNLSRPLSLPPCLLPPICSSQGRPWARPGPLPLCPRLSVSLCPVTSGSFSGADHLFPGCLAAVLMLWCGQNNSDFLIPSAVNLGSLLLSHSIFNLTLPLQLFQSPLPPRACLREHVSMCACVCLWGMHACVCSAVAHLREGAPRVLGRFPCCLDGARFSQQLHRASESRGVCPRNCCLLNVSQFTCTPWHARASPNVCPLGI